MRFASPSLIVLIVTCALFQTAPQALSETDAKPAPVDFLRDVRPILSGHCFKCHGPDEATREAGLRLDVRDEALKEAESGYTALVPGDPDESEVIFRITTDEEESLMPPPSAKLALTAEQKDILKRWVADGAEYTPHWAFEAPTKPAPPEVDQSAWPANPIDHFVLNRLEKAGLKPSPEADKYTLVRRVYLDLIGLPPTPAEADAFVNDPSPDAYDKLVDRLLASKHYGERWARSWLDLARYADTNGYEKDRPRSIWPYRDWVINAINEDMPFDQFTIEQLAGDLLPNATLDQVIATGFHRNSMINEEGGNDPQEYRFHSIVDRVHVTATTWLGLTMSCAQCHTHKYDPIQHEEYYGFFALHNNADEPQIDVPQPDITARRNELLAKIADLENALPAEFPPQLKADWITPARAAFSADGGVAAELLPDGSFRVEGDTPDKDTYTVTLESGLQPVSHLQVQVIPDDALPSNGPGRNDNGNLVLSEVEVEAAPLDGSAEPVRVKLIEAAADHAQNGFPARNAIDGRDDTGWAIQSSGNWHVARTLTLTFNEPVDFASGAKFTVRLKQQYGQKHLIGRFRLGLGRELPDDRPLEVRRREHLDLRLARWLDREIPRASDWTLLKPTSVHADVPTLLVEDETTVFAGGDFTKSDTYVTKFNGDWRGVRAIRLEALPDERLLGGGPGRVYYEGPAGDFFMVDFKVRKDDDVLKLVAATESHANGDKVAAKTIDDDLESGWSIHGGQGREQSAVFVFDQPLDFEGELTVEMLFARYYASPLGKYRVWVTRDENAVAQPFPSKVQDTLAKLRGDLSEVERARMMSALREYYVTIAPELVDERDEIASMKRRLPNHPTTLVMRERPATHPRETRLHKRGEFLTPAQVVEPGVPAFLPDLPADAPRNRLGLARWLVSRENPLTARVTMNRDWTIFFGRGLVTTTEDFGLQGKLPTHPQLLDWLAVEFMDREWSRKAMHKLIVTSKTYRQSSSVPDALLAADPENVLLSRGPRFRLEAELIRDTGLVASGLFSDKLGGPSVYPPQPKNVTTEGAYGQLTWAVSEGEDRYRRGLYTFAKRTAPFAMFNAFDAPAGEACMARRDRSNTPLQSLTLLNDTMFVEFAQALGREAAELEGDAADRARWVFRRCLTRPPEQAELEKLTSFYQRQLDRLRSGELKAAELLGEHAGENPEEQAAWMAVARVLMNLDETVTKG